MGQDRESPEESDREARGDLGAWEAARRAGVDLSLLLENLRRTPVQRIEAHERARRLAEELRRVMKGVDG